MLKRAYVSVAQAVPGLLALDDAFAPVAQTPHGVRRWAASLGAIYHLDRMIALDVPWWNVAATVAIERFLAGRSDANVFEYGSGASTIWLARRAATVRTVEHDADWAARVADRASAHPNVGLRVETFDRDGAWAEQPYVRAIDGSGLHDLIVVDGRLRPACLEAAIAHLKPDGILLFDNSARRRYRDAITACGLVERRLRGLTYCLPYPDQTSLLTFRPAQER